MTKAELIDRISRSRELPPEVTKKVIAKILDLTFAELAAYFVRARVSRTSSPRFTYPKFGTFTKKRRSGRMGVNPRTLEPMEIEACETVDFKPSTDLKRQLNEVGAKPATPAAAKPARKKKKARAKKASTKKSSAKRASAKAKSSKTRAKAQPPASAGPRGRKLVTREEAELELSSEARLLPDAPLLLPDAPLQKASRRRRSKTRGTGS